MSQAKFASLALFEQNLEFKASLLDERVDAKLLSNLEPSPAQVFREAHDLDGASTDDIKLFLKALKGIQGSDNQPLVTRDGLDFLTNILWDMTWKERNALAKARANEPRKQRRHEDICDGAATWPGVVDADEQSWPPKPTAKRKAPIDCIDHAHTHTPGMPIGSPSTADGQAEVKLSEAARALRERSPPQTSKPSEGTPALSSWLKQQEALMAAKGDTSTLSTWLSQQRALMAAAQHVSTESDVSAHSGPDCSASEGTGMGTMAIINERAGKGGDAVLAATADSADKLRGANSPYVMLMASMKAAMADAEFQKVKMSVMQFRQSKDVKQFARKLVAAVRVNPQAQTLLPQLAAVVPRNEREVFKAHIQTLVKVLPRIELGLALLSPSQKQAVNDLGAMVSAGADGNPSTEGTNHTTEEALASPQLRRDARDGRSNPSDAVTFSPESARAPGRVTHEAVDDGTVVVTASDILPALTATTDDVDMCTDEKS